MAALLLAAGFETTTGLLSNGLAALLAPRTRRPGCGPATSSALPRPRSCCAYDSPVQMLFGRSAPDADHRRVRLSTPASG